MGCDVYVVIAWVIVSFRFKLKMLNIVIWHCIIVKDKEGRKDIYLRKLKCETNAKCKIWNSNVCGS